MNDTKTLADSRTMDSSWWSPAAMIALTIGLFFAAQFAASILVLALIHSLALDNGQLGSVSLTTLQQFVFVLIANGFIIFGVWRLLRSRKLSFKRVGLARPRWRDALLAIAAYVCYIVIFIIVATVVRAVLPFIDFDQQQQLGFEISKSLPALIMSGISLVILPPIVEEILCRGFLYTGLRSRFNFTWSAVITSLVFAAAHLQWGSDAPLLWVAAIDTFILSLVLVCLRETTGRLAAPMLLHGLKNSIAFSLLFIFAN